MPNKSKAKAREQNNIIVGDINHATGIAIGSRAEAKVSQVTNLAADELTRTFAEINAKISLLLDGPDKTIAQSAVQGLEVEAQKGNHANEQNVTNWMNFLAQAAPDAFDVA